MGLKKPAMYIYVSISYRNAHNNCLLSFKKVQGTWQQFYLVENYYSESKSLRLLNGSEIFQDKTKMYSMGNTTIFKML